MRSPDDDRGELLPRRSIIRSDAFERRMQVGSSWVLGGMALGIASVGLITAATRAGHLGFFGAAGLPLQQVEDALASLRATRLKFGINLAHHPDEGRDGALVGLALKHHAHALEASAFLRPSMQVMRFRYSGCLDGDGRLQPRRVLAKCSNIDLCRAWLAPPAPRLLRRLYDEKWLTHDECLQAERIPIVDGVTAEGDSGGHTDRKNLMHLVPAFLAEAAQAQQMSKWELFVGAAGGLGSPESIAAAWMLGADYLVGGSVHQICEESGVSSAARARLARATTDEFTYIPAVDSLNTGARVQVLKNRLARRALRLEALLRRHPNLFTLVDEDRALCEELWGSRGVRQGLDALRSWEAERRQGTGRGRPAPPSGSRGDEYKGKPNDDQGADPEPIDQESVSLDIFRHWLGTSARAACDPAADPEDAQLWASRALAEFNRHRSIWPCQGTRFSDLVPPLLQDAEQLLQQRLSALRP